MPSPRYRGRTPVTFRLAAIQPHPCFATGRPRRQGLRADAKAGEMGVTMCTFGETWMPGYPRWVQARIPYQQRRALTARYLGAAVTIPDIRVSGEVRVTDAADKGQRSCRRRAAAVGCILNRAVTNWRVGRHVLVCNVYAASARQSSNRRWARLSAVRSLSVALRSGDRPTLRPTRLLHAAGVSRPSRTACNRPSSSRRASTRSSMSMVRPPIASRTGSSTATGRPRSRWLALS